jgi:hypothetical protein
VVKFISPISSVQPASTQGKHYSEENIDLGQVEWRNRLEVGILTDRRMTMRKVPIAALARLLTMVGCLAVLSGPGMGAPNSLTREEVDDGWILLFDGESMFGWTAASAVDWRVEAGAIVATQGTMGLLHTLGDFDNYILSLEFRAAPATNSGVFLRTAPVCTDAGPHGEGYELNIAPPDNPFPTGSLVQRARVSQPRGTDGWQRYWVLVLGSRIEVWLDDSRVLGYTDPVALRSGKIGLQFNQGRIEFRSIKLKPLLLEPIFNGRDLSGWSVLPDRASRFSVSDSGELRILNGPGAIETLDAYSDFLLQLKVKCNGAGLNSGVFFRSIPGEFWQGYESQIQNGFKDGDRTKPVDFGTGGIYRRVPARTVVSDDLVWFSKTILASGPNLLVWVNGYPVTAWTDTREASSNPRNGLRLKAGTIQLQGHDPTTDLAFRDLAVTRSTVR